jgi:hypothetical protein
MSIICRAEDQSFKKANLPQLASAWREQWH